MPSTKYIIQAHSLADVPEIFQLRNDELGADALRLMKERFGYHKYLQVVVPDRKNQPIKGSNSYIRFALGPIVKELYGNNIQLISPAISEIALKYGKLSDATSTYEDLGVVVYSLKGPNEQLAKHLVEKARERGMDVGKFPIVFHGLKTVRDNKFPDGLRLDLDDIAVAYHVPILSKKTSSFKSTDSNLVQNGFPRKLEKGYRILYTTNSGLRRIHRDGCLNLDASGNDLPYSNDAGRVSFVKNGTSPQNLETALAKLEAERKKQIAQVDKRFKRAMEIMNG